MVDSGFPQSGGANPRRRGPTYDFPQNCIKLKEFGPLVAGPNFYYVDPPLSLDPSNGIKDKCVYLAVIRRAVRNQGY